MQTNEIYTRVAGFINKALRNPAIKVRQAYIDKTPVLKPFVMINIPSFHSASLTTRGKVDEQGMQEVIYNETVLVSLQAFSDVLHEALDIIKKICWRLQTSDIDNYFSGELGYRRRIGDIRSFPEGRGLEYESRAAVDLEFGVRHTEIHDAGIIERVSITNKMRNETFEVSK